MDQLFGFPVVTVIIATDRHAIQATIICGSFNGSRLSLTLLASRIYQMLNNTNTLEAFCHLHCLTEPALNSEYG